MYLPRGLRVHYIRPRTIKAILFCNVNYMDASLLQTRLINCADNRVEVN